MDAIWFLGPIAVAAIGLVIWFNVPGSPTRADFRRRTAGLTGDAGRDEPRPVFTEEDIAPLPEPVRKHIRWCGHIGKPKMTHMRITFKDVPFVLAGRKLRIDYVQCNRASEPARVAYIGTSLYGIPFEGMDAYLDGKGSMKGVLAKLIPLFHQTGPSLDRSCLVTCLAESLLIPSLALQAHVRWEEVDGAHARATMEHCGTTVGGVFEFGENGEMIRFTTEDREYADPFGEPRSVGWSAICGDYKESGGIRHPASLKAVWHLESGDLVYFDGRDFRVEYDVTD